MGPSGLSFQKQSLDIHFRVPSSYWWSEVIDDAELSLQVVASRIGFEPRIYGTVDLCPHQYTKGALTTSHMARWSGYSQPPSPTGRHFLLLHFPKTYHFSWSTYLCNYDHNLCSWPRPASLSPETSAFSANNRNSIGDFLGNSMLTFLGIQENTNQMYNGYLFNCFVHRSSQRKFVARNFIVRQWNWLRIFWEFYETNFSNFRESCKNWLSKSPKYSKSVSLKENEISS